MDGGGPVSVDPPRTFSAIDNPLPCCCCCSSCANKTGLQIIQKEEWNVAEAEDMEHHRRKNMFITGIEMRLKDTIEFYLVCLYCKVLMYARSHQDNLPVGYYND